MDQSDHALPPLNDDEIRGYVAVARDPVVILEDYAPIWNSLDLRLGRAFWRERGVQAFLGGDVPYGATSGGRLADDALGILLARWSERPFQGTVRLLEVGAGSGLFAKILLDRLAALSPELYAQTQFVVTDNSKSMREGMLEFGVLDAHRDRIKLAALDATQPVAEQLEQAGEKGEGYHGIFANYVLDSMAFAIRARRGESMWRMDVRTALDDSADLRRYFPGDVAELKDALAKMDDSPAPELARLHQALVVDARYTPTSAEDVAYPETLPNFDCNTAASETVLLLDNYGAIQLLDQLTEVLDPTGVLLFTDYGHTSDLEGGDLLEYQRFGGSAAVGVNFAQVDRWAGARDNVWLSKPVEDPESLMTRAITRETSPAVAESMEALCSAERVNALQASLETARALARSHAVEAARWSYDKALRLQPFNWNALEEVALFLISVANDPDGGLAVLSRALDLNPISPNAYHLMGRALWQKEQREAAERAYRRALELDSGNVPVRVDLVRPLIDRGEYAEALVLVAEALAYDDNCEYRDELLGAQSDVLHEATKQAKEELLRGANRIRRHRGLPST